MNWGFLYVQVLAEVMAVGETAQGGEHGIKTLLWSVRNDEEEEQVKEAERGGNRQSR